MSTAPGYTPVEVWPPCPPEWDRFAMVAAVEHLLELDETMWFDQATAFTCMEAEAIANVYRAAGRNECAAEFIDIHSREDEEGDAHYVGGASNG